jgi:hypothetical protein
MIFRTSEARSPVGPAFCAAALSTILAGCSGNQSALPNAGFATLPGITAPASSLSDHSGAIADRVGCSGQNLITDGDFETPALPSGGAQGFDVGSSLGAWTVIGPAGDSVALLNATYSDGGYTFNPQAGQQSIDLTILPNGPAGLEQTVTLQANQEYTLCFWIGNIRDPGGIFGKSSKDVVMVNGQEIKVAKNGRGTLGSGVIVWKQYKASFTVPGGATTISFNNGDPTSDNYNGLDSVALVQD